jgi:hypothetical protein
MKPESRLHKHPNAAAHADGKYTYVHGHLLEAGDELRATDVYPSSNGYWEPCPCPGLTLQAGVNIMWVRRS